MGLTKIEVARRQLVTAINLFLNEGDSVSVYTLAHTAWEVIDNLCQHHQKPRMRIALAEDNNKSMRDIKNIIEYGRNFMKHAERDPEEVLEDFEDKLNEHVLFLASYDYTNLVKQLPVELQLFKLWYLAINPIYIPSQEEELKQLINKLFPELETKDKAMQKRVGAKLLMHFKNDPSIMAAPETDTSCAGAL